MEASHVGIYDLLERSSVTDTSFVINIEPPQNIRNVEPRTPLKVPERSTAFLDGLRGLAALCVCIQHFVGGFDGNLHEHGFGENGHYYIASLPFLRIFFSGGSAAVPIFFVLSGYVLTKSPLRLLRDGRRDACILSLISAVIRRPIRLYVPSLGVTFIYGILMHAPFGLVPVSIWAQPQDTLFAELEHWIVESLRFFNPFRTHGSNQTWFPYSVVIWTLPIELKGSMLVYVVTVTCAISSLPGYISLALLVTSVPVLLHFAEWTMACFLAGLVLACIDTHAVHDEVFVPRLKQRARFVLHNVMFIIGYYLLSQPAHDGHPEFSVGTPGWYRLTLLVPRAYDENQYYRYWHSWGACLVLYSSLHIAWLQWLLHSQPLRYLGKVSFMLYLVHLPLAGIMSERLQRLLGQVPPDGEKLWYDNKLYLPDFGPVGMSLRFLVSLAIWLPVCLAVADFATRVLDQPSVRAGKAFVHKLGLGGGVSTRRVSTVEAACAAPQDVPMQSRAAMHSYS